MLCLLREGGYDSVTMEGVAARTKCGKATLYRQWGTKPQLVTAALAKQRCTFFAGIDTGTLAGTSVRPPTSPRPAATTTPS